MVPEVEIQAGISHQTDMELVLALHYRKEASQEDL